MELGVLLGKVFFIRAQIINQIWRGKKSCWLRKVGKSIMLIHLLKVNIERMIVILLIAFMILF